MEGMEGKGGGTVKERLDDGRAFSCMRGALRDGAGRLMRGRGRGRARAACLVRLGS
jgi:hypothetical protein